MSALSRAVAGAAFAAAISLGSVCAAHAQSEGQQAPEENPRPWIVNCSTQNATGDLLCNMSQILSSRESGQRVLAAVIFREGGAGGPVMMRLGLPHGIRLLDGATIWVDSGQRSTHAIATADQNGSYATVPLEGPIVAALRAGRILNVMVKASGGEEIVLQLSLAGFSAALDRV